VDCKQNWSLSVGKGAKMLIDDLGLEPVIEPVKKIRVQFYRGKWYVEYRRQPKYFFDAWWWFDDSVHVEYNDAYRRAQTLMSDGGIKSLQHKKLEIDMKDF
jgi:hypothetical protein